MKLDNLKTADEARQVFCCVEPIRKCRSIVCQAWRWGITRRDVAGSHLTEPLPPEQRLGYCGRAGLP